MSSSSSLSARLSCLTYFFLCVSEAGGFLIELKPFPCNRVKPCTMYHATMQDHVTMQPDIPAIRSTCALPDKGFPCPTSPSLQAVAIQHSLLVRHQETRAALNSTFPLAVLERGASGGYLWFRFSTPTKVWSVLYNLMETSSKRWMWTTWSALENQKRKGSRQESLSVRL